jgi:hypothetical protein
MNPRNEQALFLKLNPSIGLRKPEGTSIHRINSFDHVTVNEYFDNMELVLKKHVVDSKIFNLE